MLAAPSWVMTPYQSEALRASRLWRWSVRMRSMELTAMSSHENKKLTMLAAIGTASNAKMNVIRSARALRDLISSRA